MVPSMRRNAIAAVALLLAANSPRASSFQPAPTARSAPRPLTPLHAVDPPSEDLPFEEEAAVGEEYSGAVDWDAEWKKVVDGRDQPEKRPGNYKSQAEIAAIKATNKVAKNVFDASRDARDRMPSANNLRSLQGDWRFWIGIIAIVSFGLSILSATPAANDSFFV